MAEVKTESVVDGRYKVLRKLGSGGMADVYLCEDVTLGRKVALKVLHGRFAQDREFVERFQREAQAAAGLQHPNVVSIYDRGRYEDTYYMVMEYLEGHTLKGLISSEAPLDPVRALGLAKQILAGLRYAHRDKIIHRDVKPQNVMVDEEDRVKVADFGIARAGGSDITEAGSIMGTAQYISPEQAQGKTVSQASDIYSVGVVLYEMLTGRVPFDGDSAVAIALKHVNEQPPSIRECEPDVPEEIEAVVMRALAKDPSQRYPTAESFIRTLDRLEGSLQAGGGGQKTSAWAAVDGQAASAESAAAAPGKGESQEPGEDGGKALGPEAEGDKEEGPGKRRRKKMMIVIGSGLAVVALALAAFFLFLRPGDVEVPNLIGQEVEDARSRLEGSDLEVNVKRVNSDAALGQVLEQDPIAGEKVAGGSTVKLTVSKGPGFTKIPSVAGLTEEEAKSRLKKEKFKSTVEREHSTDVDFGLVVRTDPGGGETAAVGSEVLLVVSRGPAKVDVPDVVGLSSEEAESKLKDLKLSVVVEQEDSTEDKGTVIEQTPGAGATVDEDTTVTLVVSNGKGVEVPGVIGLSENAARSKLEKAGFEVSERDRSTDRVDRDGIVLSQKPSKGKAGRKGDTVTITIGRFETPPP